MRGHLAGPVIQEQLPDIIGHGIQWLRAFRLVVGLSYDDIGILVDLNGIAVKLLVHYEF